MASHTIIHFSPSKAKHFATEGSPIRTKTPSPQKHRLPYTTFILPQKKSNEPSLGSPAKRLKTNDGREIEPIVQLDVKQDDITKSIAQSKRLKLPYSLVENGRPITPPSADFSDLFGLFPTTFSIELIPSFLIFRVREIPVKPWPLTIGGLPISIVSDDIQPGFYHGRRGKGPRALDDLKMRTLHDYSQSILNRSAKLFEDLKQKIVDIYWFGTFWRITTSDTVDWNCLPTRIGDAPCFYRTESELSDVDLAVLRRKPPKGMQFDDTDYYINENALLRPGIMLSSSKFSVTENGETNEQFYTTSSGILVADRYGQIFITVAAHGFREDREVYHPNPITGRLIGTIVEELFGTDIAVARLNPGIRYTNDIFRSEEDPAGFLIKGIAPSYPPYLKIYDEVTMNNPFTGSSEGTLMALGARIVDDPGKKKLIRHQWHTFENGDQPVDGSCGTPILDERDWLVGMFRYKEDASNLCLSVAAIELREFEYEIYGGEQTF
ncbi:MAG: hypothetical protein Q9219_006021 [cf. Caloplaca sp. 3 TL-2023]